MHDCEWFFLINKPVSFYSREGFCKVLNGLELLSSINKLILREDNSNCLIGGIDSYCGLKASFEFDQEGS